MGVWICGALAQPFRRRTAGISSIRPTRPNAINPRCQRGFGETGADRGGNIGGRLPARHLAHRTVGKGNLEHLRHDRTRLVWRRCGTSSARPEASASRNALRFEWRCRPPETPGCGSGAQRATVRPRVGIVVAVVRARMHRMDGGVAARWLIVDGGSHVNRLRPASTAIVCPAVSRVERWRTVFRKRHSQVLRAGVSSTAM